MGRQAQSTDVDTLRRSAFDEDAAPHLRALIVAALSTGCRGGELLALQWGDVQVDAQGECRALIVRAGTTKTSTTRTVPIGQRLRAVLEMGRTGPDGEKTFLQTRAW